MLHRLLEKKTAITHGALVLADQGMLAVVNFAATVFLVRNVSTNEYSAFVLAMSLVMIGMSIHRTLFIIPITVLTPNQEPAARVYFHGNLLLTAFLTGAFMAGVLYVVLDLAIPLPDAPQKHLVVWLFGGLLLSLLVREQLRATMLAVLKFREGALANCTVSSLTIVGIGGLYAYGHLTLTNLLFCLIIGHVSGAMLLFLLHRKRLRCDGTTINRHFAHSFLSGKWHSLNALLYSAAAQSLPWMLLMLCDAKSVAAYGVCMSVASLMAPFLRGVNAYLLPRLSNAESRSEQKRITLLSIKVLSAPYIFWLVLTAISGDFILRYLYTDAYAGYQLILTFIVLRMTVESVATPVSTALQSIDKPKIITVSLAVSLIITLAGGLLLIYYYELMGAAIIGVVAASFGCAFRSIMLAKNLKNTEKSQ